MIPYCFVQYMLITRSVVLTSIMLICKCTLVQLIIGEITGKVFLRLKADAWYSLTCRSKLTHYLRNKDVHSSPLIPSQNTSLRVTCPGFKQRFSSCRDPWRARARHYVWSSLFRRFLPWVCRGSSVPELKGFNRPIWEWLSGATRQVPI